MSELGVFVTITVMLVTVQLLPIWPMTRKLGYRPASIAAALLAVLIVLTFMHVI